MLAALIIGLFVAAAWEPKFWAATWMWAGAASAAGWLVGFLFGIPRSVAKGDAVIPADQAPVRKEPTAGGGGQSRGQTGAPPPNVTGETTPTPPSGGGGAQPKTSGVNTNLEEISDWLTKIIVGVGLVELRKALVELENAATLIASTLGCPAHGADPCSQISFAYAVMVYFSVTGFLGSYLLTRLYLQKALREA
jgi:hypothetical protein